MKTIAIFNMKGGVGKTTTAYNLAVGLVKFHDKRVLLVDIDPQGHATASLGIHPWDLKAQLKDVLLRNASLTDIIQSTKHGVDVAPSNLELAEQEIPISGYPGRELLLRKALSHVEDRYEVVLIDCPPNIGVFSVNALRAADFVLIPVDMSYLALLGIQSVERALSLVRDQLEHPIEIGGVLATRYDKRINLSSEVLTSLRDKFGSKLCQTIIPELVRLREAPAYHEAIFSYEPTSPASNAYESLTHEVATWL